MRLSSLLLVFSATAFTGLGLHALASDRNYDRKIERMVLNKLKNELTSNLRGTIDFHATFSPSHNRIADSTDTKSQRPMPQAPKTEQAESKLEPIVENTARIPSHIDQTLTGSVAKPEKLQLWDRFDKDGNFIDPYNPNR